jgi:hypothetical protein
MTVLIRMSERLFKAAQRMFLFSGITEMCEASSNRSFVYSYVHGRDLRTGLGLWFSYCVAIK